MTMHLVRGMTSLNTSKKKSKPNKKLQKAQEEHEAWMRARGLDKETLEKKMPKDKKGKRIGLYDIPDYSVSGNLPKLSNTVAASGIKIEEKKYTGTEIAGIVVTHKSNLMPVRRDNKQAAVDAAQMRRN